VLGKTVGGDRRLDPLAAAAYLDLPITPAATDRDRGTAQEWLAEQGLGELYAPARRWLAVFSSAAMDDPPLDRWCRLVLLA
jgi:hypothetical protein